MERQETTFLTPVSGDDKTVYKDDTVNTGEPGDGYNYVWYRGSAYRGTCVSHYRSSKYYSSERQSKYSEV